ncbi:MAG: ROK family protein [Phycicoccus sp.]
MTTSADRAAASPRAGSLRPHGKASPGDARAHNRAVILQSLFHGEPQSRADLARVTGLTRVTVSDVVSGLLRDALVTEIGLRAEARVGKPATLVALDPDAGHIVALDLSKDSRFRGALLNLRGAVLHRHEVARRGRSGGSAADLAADLAATLVDVATRPVLGVGVGSPGVVRADGRILEAPNLGWVDLSLATLIGDRVQLPTHVRNDANTAALAEHTFADAHDGGTLVLTVGQGVGAGLLLDGVLVHGNRYAAGEIGHVVLDERGPRCSCGRRGCLETYLAVPMLRREIARGDREQVLTRAGRRLGEALAPVVGTLSLTRVVLGGPRDLLDGLLLETTVDVVRKRTMPVVGDNLEVRLSPLGEDAVLLGAAVLVLSGQLGIA